MTFDPKNLVFTEKYRPAKVSDVVGEAKNKILKYMDNMSSFPHLLFYSNSPGTGKTSLAKAIINEFKCDSLIINSSDERKIETIRDKIRQFAITKSSHEGKRRIVMLDESDGILPVSQDALRNLMETYASNVIFILTANRVHKIITAIQSRCLLVPFSYPPKEEIAEYLVKICTEEKMEYSLEGIQKLIDCNYPSIRNCVIMLQDLKIENKSVIPENVKPVNAIFDTIWGLLNEKKWMAIKTIIMEGTINARELNTYLWNKFLEQENIKGIQITCRNEKDMSFGSDEKIIFITSLPEMIK